MRFVFLAALVSTAVSAAPCQELPILFVIQDKSGSMAGPPDPYGDPNAPSKWSSAAATVPPLVTEFSDRFRFGLMMFPGESTTFNCNTGTLQTAVPSTPAQVQNAYDANAPGGGTPTAVSLNAARSYLNGISTPAPKYVLLITDGLPNCDLSLNPATCETTTAGCPNTSTCSGSSCCGLGAKDCLDDNATANAAAALYAQGITVFVVGFGADVSNANDQAVLDNIAAAGGSGSSYVVNDQASLASTLGSIAASTATCCTDACSVGASSCTSSSQQQRCAVDAQSGCATWQVTNCPAMSACTGGACTSCSNQCTAGATQCSGSNAQTCQQTSSGCTQWVTTESCGYGATCSNGICNSCQGCTIGASQCTTGGAAQCQWDVLSGCTQWVTQPCANGSRCANGACAACNGTCTAGSKGCSGDTTESCVSDASGCTSWQPGQTCSNFCSGGACGVCGTSCQVGAKQCNGNGIETCVTDANGCTTWTTSATCDANEFCSAGECGTCATTCTSGTYQCGATGGIEECRVQGNGCNDWVAIASCQAGDQCSNGTCLPPCSDGCTLGATQCSGGAPSVCQTAATGCAAWKTQPACAASDTCIDGVCRQDCDNGEIDLCPTGFACTGLPQARVCLPAAPLDSSGGTDAGTTSMNPPSGTATTPMRTDGSQVDVSGAACGCSEDSATGPALFLLLGIFGWRRRRSLRQR